MTDADSMAQQMIDFISRELLRSEEPAIGADTPLFSSGLMDSMAVVDVLHRLEDVTNLKINAGRLRLKDVDTVRLMLDAAKRVGRARS